MVFLRVSGFVWVKYNWCNRKVLRFICIIAFKSIIPHQKEIKYFFQKKFTFILCLEGENFCLIPAVLYIFLLDWSSLWPLSFISIWFHMKEPHLPPSSYPYNLCVVSITFSSICLIFYFGSILRSKTYFPNRYEPVNDSFSDVTIFTWSQIPRSVFPCLISF